MKLRSATTQWEALETACAAGEEHVAILFAARQWTIHNIRECA